MIRLANYSVHGTTTIGTHTLEEAFKLFCSRAYEYPNDPVMIVELSFMKTLARYTPPGAQI